MSNHPLPPIFRAPFDSSSGKLEPSVGSYDHSLSQIPYPYQKASPLYGQGQLNGMPTVPQTNANSHFFRSNNQGMTRSGNEANEAQYPLYGGRVQYNTIQSPASPPKPFAHGAPSYEAPPFSQHSTYPNFPSKSTTAFSSTHIAADVQNTNFGDSDTVRPELSELEDGELDDGHSRANTTTPSTISRHELQEIKGSADREPKHRGTNAPNKPLPGLIEGSLATPHFQGSTASQPEPYSIRKGFIENSNEVPLSQTAKNTLAQHQLSNNTAAQGSKKTSSQLEDHKMEEAKQALRDLHSQGFDFNQIVNAGLDPDVLRKLYANIGVPVTASFSRLQQTLVKARVVAKDVPTESASGVATVGIHDQHPKSPQRHSNGDVLTNDTFSNLVAEEEKINNQAAVAGAKQEEKSAQSQASFANSSKTSSSNSLGKASRTKAGETKKLDRKEYIARMLAAKAGKPAISATTPVSTKTSTITEPGATANVRSLEAAAAIVPATIQQAPNESADTAPGLQREDSDVEAKRKAQTDLARQKIEALRLHESNQQQARTASSSGAMRHSQPPAKDLPNIPAGSSIPAPRPLPSRQSSYFSPASQPFSIPGLFMTSDAPEPVKPSQPLANDVSAVSPQRCNDATVDSPFQVLRPLAVVAAQSSPADKTMRLPETSFDLESALPATIATTASSNRKRRKASDFIDSPSTRIKRPLGQQEDTSVIIYISDDEVSDHTAGEESINTGITGYRDSPSRESQIATLGDGKVKTVKSLPRLTDFPPRKGPAVMTPPPAQASGHSGDLKGLKSKEMEIEAMNRKIAELEQRIATKTKQNTSRTHSPGTSGRVTISPPSGEISRQINGAPKVPASVSDSRNGDVVRVENREFFVALAMGSNSAAVEQLNAEQQLEEVELAKAEAERSLAAEISRASVAAQSLSHEEKPQNPQVEEQSNPQEGEQQRVQDDEQRRLQESLSRQAPEELKNLRQEEVGRQLQAQEQRRAQVALERSQEQKRKSSLEDQRHARKFEIESGLPLLDAEVERTRKRLESLRHEIASLEKELQKGIEGRQVLVEELKDLLRSREAPSEPMDIESLDVGDVPHKSTSIEENPAVTKPSTLVEMVPESNPIQLSGAVGDGIVEQEKAASARSTDDRMSDEELEEDIMDISHSDVDKADLSLYSPKPLTEVQENSSFIDDDDENYEPPSEINISQRQEPDPDAAVLHQDLGTAKADLPAATQHQPSSDQNDESIEKPASGERSPTANASMACDEPSPQLLSRSPSPAGASDPDDYEPPEPAPLGEEVPRAAQMSSADSEKSFSPPDVDTNDFVAPASSDSRPAAHQQVSVDAVTVGAGSYSVQKLEVKDKTAHFTPYESPLKQFKSFRYHPQYLEEVSRGFRSLTYSHTIDPEIPFCRYELDGICNDDSCQSQHLRSIGLSDDKILVDLGAKPEDGSSSEEFGNGLREIIHDIRSRKIKDFNIVAGEITAYRAKYLGDSSKVLPL